MHIPDVTKALSELMRVVKPGGTIIISEGNMHSPQAVILKALKLALGREKATVKKTTAGMEYWKIDDKDALVTRQADIGWLLETFKNSCFTLKKRVAGQLTEVYTMVSSASLAFDSRSQQLLVRHIRNPHLSYGNILILQKQPTPEERMNGSIAKRRQQQSKYSR